MSDDGAKLSHDELVAILKESADLEARRGAATFDRQDLMDAAKELGIDGKAASDMLEAHLARRAPVAVAPRPFDTRIELAVTPDRLSLTVPPLRPTRRTLAPIGFAVFLLGFVTFWTVGAAQSGAVFPLFSTPFWAAGIAMLTRFSLVLFQRTRLTLDRDAGELTVTPLGRRRTLRTSELRVSIGDKVRLRQDGLEMREQAAPAVLLEHGVDTVALLDGFSPQEQRWVESELKAWLANT
ncbi:MAG TPA: hypothetical protein VIF57_13720 [Polyangia bacterium]|jgi:hypothetical protein